MSKEKGRSDLYEEAVVAASKFYGVKFLTLAQTQDMIERTGLMRPDKSSLYHLCRQNRFPKKYKIGFRHFTAFKESEVKAWLQEKRKQLVRVGEVA